LLNDEFEFLYGKGLGWATLVNSFLVSIYYNMIIAWVLFYFFASFRRHLQWSDCGNWWNTARCANPGLSPCFSSIINKTIHFFLETLSLSNSTFFCNNIDRQTNCTIPILPPEEYFE
jgi:SNF family Na+-dependent transporter